MTVEGQVVDTAKTENGLEEKKVVTPETENTVEEKKVVTPFKTFATQEEFDRHCAGVLNSAKAKAEKELLSMLGLKPDEKDKLAKFKDAYDSTLSEAEKQAKNLESLTAEVAALKAEVVEKEAIIAALSKCTGKSGEDVSKYVRMAKGLVDEETTMEQALDQVLSFAKGDAKPLPKGDPLKEPDTQKAEVNPFKTGNFTEQGRLLKSDREKAREMYRAANGRYPSW